MALMAESEALIRESAAVAREKATPDTELLAIKVQVKGVGAWTLDSTGDIREQATASDDREANVQLSYASDDAFVALAHRCKTNFAISQCLLYCRSVHMCQSHDVLTALLTALLSVVHLLYRIARCPCTIPFLFLVVVEVHYRVGLSGSEAKVRNSRHSVGGDICDRDYTVYLNISQRCDNKIRRWPAEP